MGKGLLHLRFDKENFPFDKSLDSTVVAKTRFPIDKTDPSCAYTCCKCSAKIIADPRDLPERCSDCDSEYPFVRTDDYDQLTRIVF